MDEVLQFIGKYVALPILSALIALLFKNFISYLKQDFDSKLKYEIESIERKSKLSTQLNEGKSAISMTSQGRELINFNLRENDQENYRLLLIESIEMQSTPAKIALLKQNFQKDEYIHDPDSLPELLRVIAIGIMLLLGSILVAVLLAYVDPPQEIKLFFNILFIIYLLLSLVIVIFYPIYSISEYYKHGLIFRGSYAYIYSYINGVGEFNSKLSGKPKRDGIFFWWNRVDRENRGSYGFRKIESVNPAPEYNI